MNATTKNSGEKIVKTVCSTCYCGCGVLAHVKDGKVVKIKGDPEHPNNKGKLCPKGFAGIELLYHPDRLNYPMKRAGERGEGKWEEISWAEALDTIGTKLHAIKTEFGPEAVCVANGAGLYGNSGMIGNFCYYFGTPNMMSSSYICFSPTATAARATIGVAGAILASEIVFDEALNSKGILLWATNPKNSVPYPLGEGIFKVKEQGTKLIVVDPRPTDYAKVADIWLQIRPATDDALALGMMHVIINEELYDKEFVENWTSGFDALKTHVQDYPPEKVAEITWVPKEKIIAAARMFAGTRPSSVVTRVPLDQNLNAVQSSRAIFILNAICGNLDKRGGNPLPAQGNMVGEFQLWSKPTELPVEVKGKRIGAKEIPILSGPDSAPGIVHPTLWAKAVNSGEPYRPRALITCGRNQMLGDQDTKQFEKAFRQLDFSVTMDLFMTPTAELSDIVLPAVSWLERDGIKGHPAYPYIKPLQHRAVEPLYDRWDDNRFFIELGKKMGLDMPWKSLEEYYDYRVQGVADSFEELRGTNVTTMPKKFERYKDGTFQFATPSKKVELYSTFLENFGFDPLPHYMAPPEPTEEFPLVLIGGKKNVEYVHTTGRQLDMLRKRVADPPIEMNPKTAEGLGIAEGDWVWLETLPFRDKERVKFKVRLIQGSHPKVVAVEHGWWFPEKKDPTHGCYESNINVVISGDAYDPIYGSTNIKSVPCRVYKV